MNFPNIKFETKVSKAQMNSLKNNEKTIQRLCKNIQLSKLISIFVPEVVSIESLNYSYYTIENFKIADIFTRNFIDGYALSGDLCFVSNHDNNENCQIFLCDKKLTLRLDRELYYSLAAVQLTKFLKKHENEKLFVSFEVDLSIKNVHKIRNELSTDMIDQLKVNFLWKPTTEDICASSVAKFLTDMGYTVDNCENKHINNLLYSFNVPKFPGSSEINDETYDEWSNFMETISMLMLGCDAQEIANDSIDIVKMRRGTVFHYKGLIPNSMIDNLFQEIQNVISANALPYIAISSIPFSNLQKNFNTKIFFITSENIYALE